MSTDQRSPEAPATPPATPADRPPSRTAWLVLIVVVMADVMDLIDSSIATLAGPSIHADLGGGQVTVQW
ncbi:MFS transporter, partial [Streptomyces anthocyanicus]